MWSGRSDASNADGDLTITVNGIAVAIVINMTADRYVHSNSTLMVNPETAAAPTGATSLLTVAPAPFEYYLSAADTVTYTVATRTMQALNVQVVGTEIDVFEGQYPPPQPGGEFGEQFPTQNTNPGGFTSEGFVPGGLPGTGVDPNAGKRQRGPQVDMTEFGIEASPTGQRNVRGA